MKRRFTNQQEEEITRRYKAGEGTVILARLYRTSPQTIQGAVRRQGATLRPVGSTRIKRLDDELNLILKASGSESQQSIATRYGVSQATIGRLLRKNGLRSLEWRKPRKQGVQYVTRRQPTVRVGMGYLAEWIPPTHEFASMRRTNGYVLQHRLVMANHLGRSLTDVETVHHLDGRRDHNDITNLQLRTGQHGNRVAMRCIRCGSSDVVPVHLG